MIVAHNAPETPDLPTCPCCGQPSRPISLPRSALLDWVEVLHDDLATLHEHLHNLKATLEKGLP
jgi:hypothetical protein